MATQLVIQNRIFRQHASRLVQLATNCTGWLISYHDFKWYSSYMVYSVLSLCLTLLSLCWFSSFSILLHFFTAFCSLFRGLYHSANQSFHQVMPLSFSSCLKFFIKFVEIWHIIITVSRIRLTMEEEISHLLELLMMTRNLQQLSSRRSFFWGTLQFALPIPYASYSGIKHAIQYSPIFIKIPSFHVQFKHIEITNKLIDSKRGHQNLVGESLIQVGDNLVHIMTMGFANFGVCR